MYLAGWAWRARGGRGDIKMRISIKKQRINAKSEPYTGSGLAISRRRQIYAMFGVELRTHGEIFVKS